MDKMTDSGPAIRDLKKIGYRPIKAVMLTGVRDCFLVDTGHGELKVKVQMRRPGTVDQNGRVYFGISEPGLRQVDELVLWAEGESCLYVIPTEFLLGVLEGMGNSARFVKNQWRVNVYFHLEKNMIPVGGERIALSDFAHDTSS